MKRYLFVTIALFTMFFLCPMGALATPGLKIHVSILPHQYITKRITGTLCEVDVLVLPGKSPATYAPTPSQIKRLSQADVYFRTGVPFENGLMHKIESVARKVTIVDLRSGIALRDMKSHSHEEEHEQAEMHEKKHHHDTHHESEGHTHHNDTEHQEEDHHIHMGKDPHIWMSPSLVKKQAKTILEALVRLDAKNAPVYKKNYARLTKDLDALHQKLNKQLLPFRGSNIFVFHPVLGYFAQTYGLHQIAVETMGKAPKGKELARLIQLAKKEKAKILFVQPQFDQSAAKLIANAIGGRVVSIDPLAYNYIDNMKHMADTLSGSLKP